MNILGLSAFYHDSAAALVSDGQILAAAQEERFTRKKHDERFPVEAVRYCLGAAKIDLSGLDYVVFYEKPLLKFDRLLETYLAYAPRGFSSFRKAMPLWLKQKLFARRELNKGLMESGAGKLRAPLVFTGHHESHAASAFFPSPFEEAAILTVDGVGEWTTTSLWQGCGNKIQLLSELRFPHSLGLLYSAFTYYTGFRVNSGEYKLMGLAPYGVPKYADLIEKHLIHIKEDGSFWLDETYFTYSHGLTMTGRKFEGLFGEPRRLPESALTQFHMDVGASIQKVTEKVMLRLARHAAKVTASKNLCLAGGVALNCVANGKILADGAFDKMWVQPAAGDAGGALGAALFVWHQLLQKERWPPPVSDFQRGSLIGPSFEDAAIRRHLDEAGAVYEVMPDDDSLCLEVSSQLASEKVVGWFQGGMEFGPRALGGRSIIGDARSTAMQRDMNLKIKFRESFRPFAPSVLAEKAHEYFSIDAGVESPYMLMVSPVRDGVRIGDAAALEKAVGLDKLPVTRSTIQAVTHVDYSARVQTVDEGRNPLYHRLISAFHARTGCPVIINTSFNVRGEPIVCTPQDAYRCFMATNIDVLVLGRQVLRKEKQPNAAAIDVAAHLAKFSLD
jgi:carbamoyltransferase